MQRKTGATSPRISLWLTGLKETIDQLPAFVRLAASMGVREVYLQRLTYDEAGYGLARFESSLFEPLRADESRAIEDAVALARGLGIALDASGATEPGLSLKQQDAAQPWSACRRPWSLMYFTAHGRALPCCDPLADDLTDLIAGMPGGPGIDVRATMRVDILRHMRGDLEFTRRGHEGGYVIGLVRANCRARRARQIAQHRADCGSALPVACVSRASTTRPLRFSISRCPVNASLASWPLDFRARRASGSVVEACVAFESLSR